MRERLHSWSGLILCFLGFLYFLLASFVLSNSDIGKSVLLGIMLVFLPTFAVWGYTEEADDDF